MPLDSNTLTLAVNKQLANIVDTIAHEVPDPRNSKGVRYPFRFLIELSVSAFIGGANSVEAIVDWHKARNSASKIPVAGTFRYLFAQMKGNPVMAALRGLCAQSEHDNDTVETLPLCDRLVAVDGKVLRGSYTDDKSKQVKILNVTDGYAMPLTHHEVPGDTTEVTVFKAALAPLDITGAVVAADAAHTSVSNALFLLESKAGFFMAVKGNQPTILDVIRTFLDDPKSDTRTTTVVNSGHGRVEKRTVTVMDAPKYFGALLPGTQQILAIENERTVLSKSLGIEKTTIETRFYATTLARDKAGPEDLLNLRRTYWAAVENGLHHVLDETMGEDRSRIRSGGSAAVVSALRKVALTILRSLGLTAIAQARRLYAGL